MGGRVRRRDRREHYCLGVSAFGAGRNRRFFRNRPDRFEGRCFEGRDSGHPEQHARGRNGSNDHGRHYCAGRSAAPVGEQYRAQARRRARCGCLRDRCLRPPGPRHPHNTSCHALKHLWRMAAQPGTSNTCETSACRPWRQTQSTPRTSWMVMVFADPLSGNRAKPVNASF